MPNMEDKLSRLLELIQIEEKEDEVVINFSKNVNIKIDGDSLVSLSGSFVLKTGDNGKIFLNPDIKSESLETTQDAVKSSEEDLKGNYEKFLRESKERKFKDC